MNDRQVRAAHSELLRNLATLRAVLKMPRPTWTAAETSRVALGLVESYIEAAERPRRPTCTGPVEAS